MKLEIFVSFQTISFNEKEKRSPFASYFYDPYGNLTHTQVTTTTLLSNLSFSQTLASLQPLRYSSYFFDSETSLYYLSQRYYDPETYSFLSKDPAKADGEESTYQYCGGDPVNKVDLTGRLWRRALGGTLAYRGWHLYWANYYRREYIAFRNSGLFGVTKTRILS